MSTRGAPRGTRIAWVRGRLGWLALGLVLATAAPAQADPRARARAALDTGMKAFKAGRYERALEAFRDAEEHGAMIGELDRIRWNIARSLEELGRYPEMLVALDRCLEVATTPSKRARVETRINAIEGRLFAVVKVRCGAPDTQVSLDDGPPTACPAVLRRVPPGEHQVKATLDGRPFRAQTVQLQAASRVELRFEKAGSLEVTGPRGARITLAGAPLGTAPVAIRALPPGYYPVGIDGEDRRIAVRPGAATRVDGARTVSTPIEPSVSDSGGGGFVRWRPWIAGGASLGLLTTATLFGITAKEEWDAAHDLAARQRSADPADQPALRARALEAADATRKAQIVAGASLVAGLAAGGLAWWWFDSAPDVAVSPTGVQLRLRF